MVERCTECQDAIPDDELVTSEGMDGLPGSPYHAACLAKNTEAAKDDYARMSLTVAMKESEREEKEANLRTNLLKGKWFLKGAEALIKINPIYYDKNGTWWMWNHQTNTWEQSDDVRILITCRKTLELFGDTSVRHSHSLLKAIQQIGGDLQPKEPPLNWVQFGPAFYDIKTGKTHTSTPEYFSTNTIPWRVGQTTDTPVLDNLIESWVGKEHVQTIYEIIAYCTYRDYPIHRIFCFYGSGANGKTRLLKVIEKFLGKPNSSSTSIKKITDNSFALYQLYRKLVCFVGETTHHKLDSTEILKKLSGQDPVDFEAKGQDSFSETNYAKLMIGTNTLPPANDTSRGWYRRWLVIRFPNEFQEGEDVLARIPDSEYENLAAKCLRILPVLLQRGGFSTEGSIEHRQQEYVKYSNPIKQFLDDNYERDADADIRYSDCYLAYLAFLQSRKMRRINKKEFTSILEDEGLESDRKNIKQYDGSITTSFYIKGLKAKNTENTNNTDVLFTPDSLYRKIENNRNSGIIGINGISVPSWADFLDNQPGGTGAVDEFLAVLASCTPSVSYEDLKSRGEIYEPRPGVVRRVL